MKVQKSESGPLIVQHAKTGSKYTAVVLFGSWSSEQACGWVSVLLYEASLDISTKTSP